MRVWKWLLVLAAIAVVIVAALKCLRGSGQPDIRWVEVTRGAIEKQAVATGTIGPEFEVTVKPQISGIVSQVFRRMGEKVAAGEPLVKIKPNPTPFDSVAAKRGVEAAKLNEERAIEFREGENLAARLMGVMMGEKEMQRQYEQARLGRVRAEEQLALLKQGKVIMDDEVIDSVVTSPIEGYILERRVNVGDPVDALGSQGGGTVLCVLADMDTLVFRGTVDEIDVGRLTEGLEARIQVGALPNCLLKGRLEEISLKARQRDSATVFEVRLSLEKAEDVVLRAGYSATANILVQKKEDILLLPERVIERRNGVGFVQVVLEKAEGAETREVKTGLSDGLMTEIVSGLEEGDRVLERTYEEIE
ncbi:MAG: efflux RND transporter periplasmic adaptor subunit [Phycisphaerales bacterium]|nr:MAG: efflux RND transporter periplasmic adaptor subunit [Phycisphaerales bacterium]